MSRTNGSSVSLSRMDRIVLGTVQLGLPYGRRQSEGRMPVELAFEILDAAWELGLRNFDTAESYGDSAARLAAWLEQRGHGPATNVVTKVTADPPLEAVRRAEAALDRFPIVNALTLLTHGAANGREWKNIAAVAAERGVAAGQSVYTAAETACAVRLDGVSRVQAPGNVFDHRALQARGKSAVPLDLRSVFLQGVLLQAPVAAEARVVGAGVLAAAVQRAAAALGVMPGKMLIAAMDRAGRVGDRLVVGVDTPDQLTTIAGAWTVPSELVDAFAEEVCGCAPAIEDDDVLDPRTWTNDGKELQAN